MVRILVAIPVTVVLLTACQSVAPRSDSSGPRFTGGDGLTIEHPLVMTGGSELTNTDAEYTWIRSHEPGAKVTRQELIALNKRVIDKLDVMLQDGSSKSYYFDITDGFGKF